MLAEMDEEFGVGELVRESIKEEKSKVSQQNSDESIYPCISLTCLTYMFILCVCDIASLPDRPTLRGT